MLGDKRTTVTVDDLVVELLAIKLDTTPGTKEARKAVRCWFQSQLDEVNVPNMVYVSRWLHDQALKYLVDKELLEKHWDWVYENVPDPI